MNEAETVALLCELLYTREPFAHVRFGDGDVFFATGTGPVMTADGEEWSPELAGRLLEAWSALGRAKTLLLGDLRSYAVSDGCESQWDRLVASLLKQRPADMPLTWVHMEALRVGFGHALPFYEAVRSDTRRKVFVGPDRLIPIATLLGCVHIPVPLGTAHKVAEEQAAAVFGVAAEVALFAAGRGGKIMQSILSHESPGLTQIDIGSGVDLLIKDGVRRGTDLGVDRAEVLGQYRLAGLAP